MDKICIRCKKTFPYKKGYGQKRWVKIKYCIRACFLKDLSGEKNPFYGKNHTEEAKKINRQKHIGNIGYWLGKKRDKETVEKMRIANKGKGSPATLKRGFGENAANWRGGKTKELKRLRNSTQYSEWRWAVFIRDNFTCVLCGIKGERLNADHIKPFAYYPDLRFELSNGRTLCVPCHKNTDTYASKNAARKFVEGK